MNIKTIKILSGFIAVLFSCLLVSSSKAQTESPSPSTPPSSQEDLTIDEMLENNRQREEQKNQEELVRFLTNFSHKFGYDMTNYTLKHKLSGDNITVWGVSYWVKFEVNPKEGTIKVLHTTAIRDKFWGTTHWYDHEMVSVKFMLDPEACQIIFEGKNCEFSGTDTIQLPGFLDNHQILKYGKWHITYIESQEEREAIFRIPLKKMPVSANSNAKMPAIEAESCKMFPNGLHCPQSAQSPVP